MLGFQELRQEANFLKPLMNLPYSKKHELYLASGWYSGTILDNDLEKEKEKAHEQLTLFRDLNAPCLVYGETAGTIQKCSKCPFEHQKKNSEILKNMAKN